MLLQQQLLLFLLLLRKKICIDFDFLVAHATKCPAATMCGSNVTLPAAARCQLPARVALANCLCNKSVESSVHAVQRATLHPLPLPLLPHSTLDSSNCPLISDKRRHNLILPRAYLHFDFDSCRRCRRLFLCLCPCLCLCLFPVLLPWPTPKWATSSLTGNQRNWPPLDSRQAN